MTTGHDAGNGVVGGPARHTPVLVREVVELLAPRPGGLYVDGTFGAGGYTRAILAAADCRVIAIDRDQQAVARGFDLVAAAGGRLTLVQERFSEVEAVGRSTGDTHIDGFVLDLGVSSMQLDEAERGFSFRHDGPLDMRMGSSDISVADLLRVISAEDLGWIIRALGEERHARAVARAIVAGRDERPIRTTRDLAAIVERVVRARPGDIHPATRTFQALRMFVNEELQELESALAAAERVLAPGGRLVVVSFHSLEDRIVKTALARRSVIRAPSRHVPETASPPPTFMLLTKRPVVPGTAETTANPRARSAKLRAAERTAAPAPEGASETQLPRLPSLAAIMRGHSA